MLIFSLYSESYIPIISTGARRFRGRKRIGARFIRPDNERIPSPSATGGPPHSSPAVGPGSQGSAGVFQSDWGQYKELPGNLQYAQMSPQVGSPWSHKRLRGAAYP